MTTLRQAHKKSFTVITNKLAQDNTLSLRARGLMLYLLSLPDNWKIHVSHLVKIMREGRLQITATIQELKEAKYLRHHKLGFKEGWQYFVFESPIQEDAFKEFLRTLQVSEEFENTKLSGNTPPLQSTKEKYIKPSSSTKASAPTKEEEEELQKRFRERPKNAPKIKSKAKWRETVLHDIRNEAKATETASLTILRRRREAESWDGKKFNGMTVVACREFVEFTHGSFARLVAYDVSEEEWQLKTGWKT